MLDDVAHVEAVAVMRALLESPGDPFVRLAAKHWLEENHPPPEAYVAALAERSTTPRRDETRGET
jgi:hypothetical protein